MIKKIPMAQWYEKVSSKLEKYLLWLRLERGENTPQFVKRLWADFGVAFIYGVVNLYLTWMQRTDLVILGLNMICLFRAIIGNTINIDKMKIDSTDPINIEHYEGNTHFHIKNYILIPFFVMANIFLGTIIAGHLDGNNEIVKWLITFLIILVFWNEGEEMLFCAYDVIRKPDNENKVVNSN